MRIPYRFFEKMADIAFKIYVPYPTISNPNPMKRKQPMKGKTAFDSYTVIPLGKVVSSNGLYSASQ